MQRFDKPGFPSFLVPLTLCPPNQRLHVHQAALLPCLIDQGTDSSLIQAQTVADPESQIMWKVCQHPAIFASLLGFTCIWSCHLKLLKHIWYIWQWQLVESHPTLIRVDPAYGAKTTIGYKLPCQAITTLRNAPDHLSTIHFITNLFNIVSKWFTHPKSWDVTMMILKSIGKDMSMMPPIARDESLINSYVHLRRLTSAGLVRLVCTKTRASVKGPPP